MSKKTPSVIDYFSLNGDVVEEANEFDLSLIHISEPTRH